MESKQNNPELKDPIEVLDAVCDLAHRQKVGSFKFELNGLRFEANFVAEAFPNSFIKTPVTERGIDEKDPNDSPELREEREKKALEEIMYYSSGAKV